MAAFNFEFNRRQRDSKAGRLFGNIFTFIVAVPFAGIGLFFVWGAAKALRNGDVSAGMAFLAFGLVFSGIGFGLIYFAISAGRRRKAAETKWLAQTDGGKKIWLSRPDWAAGKIKSEGFGFLKLLLSFSALFFVAGIIVSFFFLRGRSFNGNDKGGFMILLVPAMALIFFIASAVGLRAQSRFGECFFEPAQVPAPLGGSLDGFIQTSALMRLENNLHLQLSCIRRTVSGKHTNDETLWEDEKVLRHDANFPSNNAGGTSIPVHFDLPQHQPESVLHGNPAIIWQLMAQSKMRGPNLFVTFELPVFHLTGATHARKEESDPTAPLQASAAEIRREEHSRIQVTDRPYGREFYFPAARNLGRVLFITLFAAGWSGIVWLMIARHAPILFPIIFGAIDIFLFCDLFSEWFRSDRVTVNNTEVVAQTRWLLFKNTRRFTAADVARFAIELRAQTYHDIKLLWREAFDERKKRLQQTGQRPPFKFSLSDPDDVTIASYIRSKPETEWLIRQMNQALGRNERGAPSTSGAIHSHSSDSGTL